MRTVTDALRSMKKYLTETLGGDFGEWEVRLWDEPGTFRYPFARIVSAGPVSHSGSAMYQEAVQPLALHLYAEPADSAEQAILVAEQLRDHIYAIFMQTYTPRRVPLWDFDGVPLTEVAHKRHPHDYLRVIDFDAQVLVNPQDERLRWVVSSLRVQWRRSGRVTSQGKPVETVTAHPIV